ncbi:hypothetical protein [Alkalibacillus silvisoli]|uniref:DNA primase n=1 Tax=Alkalibacillus silvisoli TaxID=392823 RepID=A0ABP3JGY4_9BACI
MKKWLLSILMISALVLGACGGDVEEDPMPEDDIDMEDPEDENGDMGDPEDDDMGDPEDEENGDM